ncbi:CYCLIN D1;1 [Hibiscus trionum]|uniref:CYCLIN D11 n=1 Tax=Hibiscus trionum TaxID=183268 RepID=A0A9W7MUS5_HIBTR|nr:CYCLIN D1;1 [Hibiscus trionum]
MWFHNITCGFFFVIVFHGIVLQSGKSWAMQLLSVACFSLAAKMEEMEVPALSEFQTEGCSFETKTIQRIELLVLSTLEWRMSLVTPFAFLHVFITEMCKSSPPDMKLILHLIFFTLKEINVMKHRPSVVAVAAILRGLNQRLTRKALECRVNSVSFCGFLDNEDVFTSYNLMQKLEMEEINMPKTVIFLDLSPNTSA